MTWKLPFNDMQPTFSIITVCLNNLQGIEKTHTSIALQSCHDFEWIVIDGGSVDGTAEFVQSSEIINKSISEPDKGIYDAMNKGISLANGRYFLFLNAGDYLYDRNVLENVKGALTGDLVVGWLERIKFAENAKVAKIKRIDNQDVRKKFFYNHAIPHQAAFIKSELFQKIGKYNTAYKICGDRDFFIKAFLGGATITFIQTLICVYPMDGISAQGRYRDVYNAELKRLRQDNFSLPYRIFRLFVDHIEKMLLSK